MTDTNDRYVKTGIFLAPFHATRENPLLALERDMDLLVHPRQAELPRGLDRRASFGRLRDHRLSRDVHRGGRRAHAAHPARHRRRVAALSQPVHARGPHDAARLQTRGRAMFGVGPGSLVYDADKMGLAAADQRRKLDESLDVMVELMAGRMVTKKTDWFDLREARLQLQSYSQPMMEMAVASARSPTGALQAGKHGIGMISLGGTSDDALKAHAANWGVYDGSGARERQDRRPPQVAHRDVRACGGDARAGARRREVRACGLQPLFQRGRDLPDHSAGDHRRSGRLSRSRPALPASARRRIAFGISSGCGQARTAGSAASCCWRTTGPTGRRRMRSYELMARYVHPHFQRNANALRDVELQRCDGQVRDRRRGDEEGGAGRDREVSGAQGWRLNISALHAGSRNPRVLSSVQVLRDIQLWNARRYFSDCVPSRPSSPRSTRTRRSARIYRAAGPRLRGAGY